MNSMEGIQVTKISPGRLNKQGNKMNRNKRAKATAKISCRTSQMTQPLAMLIITNLSSISTNNCQYLMLQTASNTAATRAWRCYYHYYLLWNRFFTLPDSPCYHPNLKNTCVWLMMQTDFKVVATILLVHTLSVSRTWDLLVSNGVDTSDRYIDYMYMVMLYKIIKPTFHGDTFPCWLWGNR